MTEVDNRAGLPQRAGLGACADNAEPDARVAFVGGHAERAGVVPEAAIDRLRERQAAMPGEDRIDIEEFEIMRLHACRRRGEHKAVLLGRRAMDDGDAQAVHDNVQPAGGRAEKSAPVFIQLPHRVGEPVGRQPVAFAARRETTPAIGRAGGDLVLAIAADEAHARFAEAIDDAARIGAIGDEVAGRDHAVGRYADATRFGEKRIKRVEIRIGSAEDDDGTCEDEWFGGADVHDRIFPRCGAEGQDPPTALTAM